MYYVSDYNFFHSSDVMCERKLAENIHILTYFFGLGLLTFSVWVSYILVKNINKKMYFEKWSILVLRLEIKTRVPLNMHV